MRSAVHYLPILTTALSIAFAVEIYRHWKSKENAPHLAWWTFGILLFGVGTATESLITLFGWRESFFRAWYISGALLGGSPLAQGTVYLLLSRKTANLLSVLLVIVVVLAAVCVLLTPIDYSLVEQFRPTGRVMEWGWVRAFSPLINTYALIFLVGGAVWSALKYRKNQATRGRYTGNIMIAAGALLPGIGGAFTRFGLTEVLYVTELVGLSLIYAGYRTIRAEGRTSLQQSQAQQEFHPSPQPSGSVLSEEEKK
ncbi:MAG TPA: hypothetical protein VJB38_01210 [Bacteroidota bacterium]|nr:hypothetical protein [Bacteroidota bacterium]